MTKKPQATKKRWSHEQFGYEGLEIKPGHYPHAWHPDKFSARTLSDDEIVTLRCSVDACDNDFRAPGGLARPGGMGDWRCREHRVDYDHSKLRLDLHQANQRVTDRAVVDERERIISLMDNHPPLQVYQMLIEQRPKQ